MPRNDSMITRNGVWVVMSLIVFVVQMVMVLVRLLLYKVLVCDTFFSDSFKDGFSLFVFDLFFHLSLVLHDLFLGF